MVVISWNIVQHLAIFLLDDLANNADRKLVYLSIDDRKRYLERFCHYWSPQLVKTTVI